MAEGVNHCSGDCFLREPGSLAERRGDVRRRRGLLGAGKTDVEAFCSGGKVSPRRPQMYNWLTFLIWCSVKKAGGCGS